MGRRRGWRGGPWRHGGRGDARGVQRRPPRRPYLPLPSVREGSGYARVSKEGFVSLSLSRAFEEEQRMREGRRRLSVDGPLGLLVCGTGSIFFPFADAAVVGTDFFIF